MRSARAFRNLALVTTVATFFLMLLGGYVKATHAGLACPDWPKCFGTWYPFSGAVTDFQGYTHAQVASEWFHRLVAGIVGPMILLTAILAWRQQPVDRRAAISASLALAVLPVQVLMGGLTVTSGLEALIVVGHLGFAIVIFTCLVLATVFAFYPPRRGRPDDAKAVESAGSGARVAATADEAAYATGPIHAAASVGNPTVSDYVALVKPGILALLLVAAAASLLLAPGVLTWTIGVSVIVGGAMSAGAAAAFNHVLEKDKDAVMARTRDRPVASNRVPKAHAVAFASALAFGSVVIMGLGANWLAAALSFAGLLFYVFVYTLWLKPRTPQNIVIGGAAGCFPALAGWAAVTGDVAMPAILLAALVFLWTPPHFWALAIVYKEDYAKGGFPMHPVVHGERRTKIEMLVYAVLTAVASLLLVWPWTVLGYVYGVAALALGAMFVWYAWETYRSESRAPARKLFWFSIVYLFALYLAMGVDRAFQML